ncbi:MAG: hypothetical protein U0Y10_06125 [Spirosomataceae bacterium]
MKTIKVPLFFIKLVKYEYWTWWMFYLPLLPYWLYQAFRTRSFAFFTAANPFIEQGGFFGESKINILDHIPAQYKPQTLFFTKDTSTDTVLEAIARAQLDFPLIIKPNVGERGFEVEKILHPQQLDAYLKRRPSDFIIQEYVDFQIELGVLYNRLPGRPGQVTSVTLKEFLSVTGDGVSTIEQLMEQSTRARFQIDTMRTRLGKGIEEVLPQGEVRQLEPIGNHCRGTKFLNANHLINPTLHKVFDQLAASMPDFNYGRFDLRVRSYDDLYRGQYIRVMELNGASSEPGHIYDPSYTLWKAYRDLASHWKILADICLEQRKRGVYPTPFDEVVKVAKAHFFPSKAEILT